MQLLLKEIKEDLNKWRDNHAYKLEDNTTQIDLQIQYKQYQHPSFFAEIDKTD